MSLSDCECSECCCFNIVEECDVCHASIDGKMRSVSCPVHGGIGYLPRIHCGNCLLNNALACGIFKMQGKSGESDWSFIWKGHELLGLNTSSNGGVYQSRGITPLYTDATVDTTSNELKFYRKRLNANYKECISIRFRDEQIFADMSILQSGNVLKPSPREYFNSL